MDELELSVVVPAYNEASRIALTLTKTLAYLSENHPDSELIVVDDGSTDDTALLVQNLAKSKPRLRLVQQPKNRGKGAAVRRGVLESRGKWVLFMDADLATPIEELDQLLTYATQGYPVVIGSRGLAESDIRARQPWFREMMGRTFNVLVRRLALEGFSDTQCGFKLFAGNVARDLFSHQQFDGFSFDVEILLLAKQAGYRIREVPVVWYHAPKSKVSPIFDASKMLFDVLRMRWIHRNSMQGR